ncbi:MAG: hypothetical protein JSW09_04665 [Pseudomonadota bacterium]|nr:MAG: hypothetical protein JSW09_04665 [Pseudomonadota bacterium]
MQRDPAGKRLSIIARTFLDYLKPAAKMTGDVPGLEAGTRKPPILQISNSRRKTSS